MECEIIIIQKKIIDFDLLYCLKHFVINKNNILNIEDLGTAVSGSITYFLLDEMSKSFSNCQGDFTSISPVVCKVIKTDIDKWYFIGWLDYNNQNLETISLFHLINDTRIVYCGTEINESEDNYKYTDEELEKKRLIHSIVFSFF